jgi:hypothetical protein
MTTSPAHDLLQRTDLPQVSRRFSAIFVTVGAGFRGCEKQPRNRLGEVTF